MTSELGIREVSEETGLTIDTLRWYEKEGLIPLVRRSSDGRRRYPPAAVRFIRLVQALRRTGMPVADVRDFVQLGGGAVQHHGERLALLERQSELVDARLEQLRVDREVVREKIAQFQRLIAAGLDCEDADAERLEDPLAPTARRPASGPRPSRRGAGGSAQR